MTKYSEHEKLRCKTADDLQKALDGDKIAIKSIYCDRIVDVELVARIREFVNLEYCYLSLCDANLLAARVDALEKLVTFNLQACRLNEFPILLKSALALKTLSLGNNCIETIPDDVRELKSVTELSLTQNQLRTVPDAIFDLPLTKLDLSYNQLQSLPEAISNLTRIETLLLSSNQLTQLPSGIGQLKTLQGLFLNYNDLNSLPDDILNLESLEYLSLKSNDFSSLPAGLESFSGSLKNFSIEGKFRPLFMDWTYKHGDKPIQFDLADMNLYMDATSSNFADFSNKLEEAGVGQMKSQIRNSINIKSTIPDDYSQIGSSRLGGFPDLADESQLPRSDNGIWIFLFQLNLADIAGINSYLPNSGLLSFFVRSLEQFECKVVFFEGDASQLSTVRFEPSDLTDDQDDYTASPFQVEFTEGTSLPYVNLDDPGSQQKFEAIHDEINTVGDHCLNGYTYTQHESPEVQSSNRLGGIPEEWVSLLSLGYDHQVGFCFWDAGTLTFTIHQEDLRRHDFSRVLVSLESS